MHFIILPFVNYREKLIELSVARQTLYRLRLPVCKAIRYKLIVFFARQRLHEEEIARGHAILNARRSNYNRKVSRCMLHVKRSVYFLREFIIQEQISCGGLCRSKTLIKLIKLLGFVARDATNRAEVI